MTRFRAFLVLLLAPLLFATACSNTTSSPVATVNGAEIGEAYFRDLIDVMVKNPDFAAGMVPIPMGVDEDRNRVSSTFTAALLEMEILIKLIDQEFTSRGLTMTAADTDATKAEFPENLSALLAEIPKSQSDSVINWSTQLNLLREDLASELEASGGAVSDEDVAAFYEDNKAVFESHVCSQHILVADRDTAVQVIGLLNDDGDFAELAGTFSIDPSAEFNGGDLGCSQPEMFVEPFADAVRTGEVGKVLGPVETDFGFHVIVVSSRGLSLEDAQDDIRVQIEQELAAGPAVAFGRLLDRLVRSADITVNERYGTWDPAAGQVLPPAGPSNSN